VEVKKGPKARMATTKRNLFLGSKRKTNPNSFSYPKGEVFTDIVIPKKIDFLDELGLFIGEKPIFTKKKFHRSSDCRDFMAVQMKKIVRPLFERSFKCKDFSFWITEGIGLTGVSFPF
jgi:hypothetical protein